MIELIASKINHPENYETFYGGQYSPEDQKAIDQAMEERNAINNRGPVDIQALVSGKLDEVELPGVNKPRGHGGPPPSEGKMSDGAKKPEGNGPPEGPMGDDHDGPPPMMDGPDGAPAEAQRSGFSGEKDEQGSKRSFGPEGRNGEKRTLRGRGYGQVMQDTSTTAKNYDPDNRLYFDAEYAKKLGYKDVLVYPLDYTLAGQWGSAMPKDPLCDTLAVNGLNRIHYFYAPVYPGDKLYAVEDQRDLVDLTPAEGNEYRTFRMYGHGKVYNQDGVCVGESIGYVKENLKRYIQRPEGWTREGFDFPWDSADWWERPAHKYTDEDWEKIKGWWAEEKRRGEDPLYWEDVEVGSVIPQKVVGPITEAELGSRYGMSKEPYYTIREILTDPEKAKDAVKDDMGIYTWPGNVVRGGGMPGFSFIDRPVFENSVCPHFAIAMLYNWMGDTGWLYKIAWDIMSIFPHYEGKLPPHPDEPHYISRVPFLKDKTMWTHGLGNDMCIAKGYVEKKYVQNGDYMVDLIWWLETIEGDIYEEGEATVKLPHKG